MALVWMCPQVNFFFFSAAVSSAGVESLFLWPGHSVTADSSAVCDRFGKQGRALVVNNGSELLKRQTHCHTEVWVKFNDG